MDKIEKFVLDNPFLRKRVVEVQKLDDYIYNIVFEDKKGIIFSLHPLMVGFSMSKKFDFSMDEKSPLFAENLYGLFVEGIEKIENEPIIKIKFGNFFKRFLVFEGLKRCANLLLLDGEENVIFSARSFKGEFRKGKPFEKWVPPPRSVEKNFDYLIDSFNEIHSFLLDRYKKKVKNILKGRINSLEKKSEVLLSELKEGEEFLKLEEEGKLLLTCKELHKKGKNEVKIFDYSTYPPLEKVIKINEKLTIYENAQKLFKLAKKGKERLNLLPNRIEECQKEIEKVKNEIEQIEKIEDLKTLFEKIYPQKIKSPKKEKDKLPKGVVKVEFQNGIIGFAGKNAYANEIVSFKLARGEDFWFHCADYKGTHLIVRNDKKLKELPFEVENEALKYAAKNSQAPKGNIVEVIVTKAKYLSKVKGVLGAVYVSKFKKKKIDLV